MDSSELKNKITGKSLEISRKIEENRTGLLSKIAVLEEEKKALISEMNRKEKDVLTRYIKEIKEMETIKLEFLVKNSDEIIKSTLEKKIRIDEFEKMRFSGNEMLEKGLKELEMLQNKVLQQETVFRKKMAEHDRLNEEFEKAVVEKQNREEEIRKAVLKSEEIKNELNRIRETLAKAEDEARVIIWKVEETKGEIQRLNNEIEELVKEKEMLSEVGSGLLDRRNELKINIEKENTLLEELKAGRSKLYDEKQKIEEENMVLRDALSMNEELKRVQAGVEESKHNITKLKEDLATMRKEKEDLLRQIAGKEKDVYKMKGQLAGVEESRDLFRKELASYREEMQFLDLEIKRYKEKFDQCRVETGKLEILTNKAKQSKDELAAEMERHKAECVVKKSQYGELSLKLKEVNNAIDAFKREKSDWESEKIMINASLDCIKIEENWLESRLGTVISQVIKQLWLKEKLNYKIEIKNNKVDHAG